MYFYHIRKKHEIYVFTNTHTKKHTFMLQLYAYVAFIHIYFWRERKRRGEGEIIHGRESLMSHIVLLRAHKIHTWTNHLCFSCFLFVLFLSLDQLVLTGIYTSSDDLGSCVVVLLSRVEAFLPDLLSVLLVCILVFIHKNSGQMLTGSFW